MNHRGDSTTIGIVILFGMVAVLSIGIFVVAAGSMATFEQQAESERIETSFVEFSNNMYAASGGGDGIVEMDLEVDDDRGAVALRDTGWIEVNSSGMEPINMTIGTVVYEGDDGYEVAYQAGAVFRGSGEETQVVSAPRVSYDRSDETLNFPVVSVSDEGELHGELSMRHVSTEGHSQAHVVENDTVRLTIQSEYYLGWKEYFEHEADAAAVQHVDHDEQLIEVHLEPLALPESFSTGISTLDGVDSSGSPNFDENDTEETAYPELDPVIHDMVDQENEDENREWAVDPTADPLVMSNDTIDGDLYDLQDGTYVLENGTYYTDGIDFEDDLYFDLSDGNATIVVDGDVHFGEGHEVQILDRKDNQTSVRIYMAGDFTPHGEINSEYNRSSAFLAFGTSSTGTDVEGWYTGSIITPSDEYEGPNPAFDTAQAVGECEEDDQVIMHSNPTVHGVVVAESVCIQGGEGGNEFTYDDSLEVDGIEAFPPGYALPPSLTFLNIAEHEVDVRSR